MPSKKISIKAFAQALLPLLFTAAMLASTIAKAQEQDSGILKQRFSFDTRRLSLYDALNAISQKTGYYFIYDSRIVQNDRRVKLEAKAETLENILNDLLKNPDLGYTIIAKHILISPKHSVIAPKPALARIASDSVRHLALQGTIFDINTRQPMPYVSVAVEGTAAGTITNGDGRFTLRIPQTLTSANLAITHIGYKPYRLPIALALSQSTDIYLQPSIISIQEVVIRRIDAEKFVERAVELRDRNNSTVPLYLGTFYREGVQKDGRFLSYAEAIFKVYKQPFSLATAADQVKEIKARKISNRDLSDTLVIKLKGGVATCLNLDIVKTLPDFMDKDEMYKYRYALLDIVSYDNRNAYAIGFEQRDEVTDPLYSGTLYVDTDSLAVLGADFEINPKHISKAASFLISQRSKTHIVKPVQFAYAVAYRKIGGSYVISHAKCSIKIKARKRNRLLSSDFTAFLEMATMSMEQKNVQRFERDEMLRPQAVFADVAYRYDPDFWGDFNIIVPEEQLGEALSRINAKIEQTK